MWVLTFREQTGANEVPEPLAPQPLFMAYRVVRGQFLAPLARSRPPEAAGVQEEAVDHRCNARRRAIGDVNWELDGGARRRNSRA